MLWRCKDCSTAMAVGLERCPHCNRNHIDKGEKTVAKTTALGWGSKGTNALEGVPSPGNSSPKSTEKPESKPESGKPESPSPAKTTEPRSKKDRTANASAASAADSSKDKKAGK